MPGSERSPVSASQSIRLRDGRTLAYREFGAPSGLPVIALHGTPGSGLKFASGHADAVALGVRLICPDRWGYGGTAAPTRPDLHGFAADLGELADALLLDRFALLGISGGGPYAAVGAGLLGPRITRLGLVGPVGHLARSSAGLNPFHRIAFLMLPRVPGAIRALFEFYRALTLASPYLAVQLAVSRAGHADRTLMRQRRIAVPLGLSFRDGLSAGARGASIDMALFRRPWPAASQSACPTRLWLGLQDRNVPLAPARRLAEDLGAELTELPDLGHYWMAGDCSEVLRWLALP